MTKGKIMARIADGHYALTFSNDVTRFFKVSSPTKGKWAGRTFVDMQAGDEYYPVRDAAKRTTVLRLISADPLAALAHYGHKIGRCGICNRTLTNEESRARGIGPVCADAL